MQTPTLLNHRYRLIRELGSGGFGETFLAEDTQMPSCRKCVIKKLKPVANNPQIYQLVQERFQREAAILEALGDGCNQIPKLYAYFLENDDFFLVQEYIEGETLQQKLHQQGLLSEDAVKEILNSILPVLDYVHSKRIVHRDIKPENILIRHADGKPVLIDFGAVKETMGTEMAISGESSRSIVIGTPGFMPSEQSAGRPLFASDLYSLGLTAIYLLTGKMPQQLETDPATGDLIWQHYTVNVSPSFVTFLDKAIAYHPRDRYANAKEMLQSLQYSTTPLTPTIPISHPTEVSPPLTPDIQQPTVASPQPVSVPPPQPQPSQKTGDGQKVVIIGGVIGTLMIGGLWLIGGQIFSQKNPTENFVESTPTTVASASPSTTPSSEEISNQVPPQSSNSENEQESNNTETNNTSTSTETSNTSTPSVPESTTESSITEAEAKTVINNWLQAKRVMFAPPYDPQPANELVTGEEYEKIVGTNGSINSLKNDGLYYRYGVQRIDNVDEFVVNGSEAIIQVQITEDRTLYDSNGNVIPKETDFKTRTIRYNLQFVDDRWKIASKTNLTD